MPNSIATPNGQASLENQVSHWNSLQMTQIAVTHIVRKILTFCPPTASRCVSRVPIMGSTCAPVSQTQFLCWSRMSIYYPLYIAQKSAVRADRRINQPHTFHLIQTLSKNTLTTLRKKNWEFFVARSQPKTNNEIQIRMNLVELLIMSNQHRSQDL